MSATQFSDDVVNYELLGTMAGSMQFIIYGRLKAQRACSGVVSQGLHGIFQLLL